MKNLVQILVLLVGITLIQACGGDEETNKNLSEIFGRWEASSVMIDDKEQLPDPIEDFSMWITHSQDSLEFIEFYWVELPVGDAWVANSVFSIENEDLQLDATFSKWGDTFNVETVTEKELILTGIDPQGMDVRIVATKL